MSKNIKLITGLILLLLVLVLAWLNFSGKAGDEIASQSPSNDQATENPVSIEVPDNEAKDDNENSPIDDLNYSTDSGGIDWASLPSSEITLGDEGLTITSQGSYLLKGSSSGQILVNTQGKVRLILAGVEIDTDQGAAIQIQEAEIAVIELAEDTINLVEDSSTREDQEINGAIYSSDDLIITGSGTLDLKANFEDGIVGKDDLWIEGGIIYVTSQDDGIRGKDSLTISGGRLTIDALGDGIKSSNSTELGKGQLEISGGELTISSGDDGVKAEQRIWITGGDINIVTSVEGIEAPEIVIDGGNISIYASDDGVNASASDIISTGLNITINGGNLLVEVGPGDTDALDSNGDLTITGGTVSLIGRSAVDFDGRGSFTGGQLIINGEEVTELPNQMMGGPGRGPGGPPTRP